MYQRAAVASHVGNEDSEDQPNIVQGWFRCSRIRICNIVHLHDLKAKEKGETQGFRKGISFDE